MANSKSKSKSNQEAMPIFGKNGWGKVITKLYETETFGSTYECNGDYVGYICGIDGLKSFSQRFFDRCSGQLSWNKNTPFCMCDSILNGKDVKQGRHYDYSVSVNDEGHLVVESEHWSSNTSFKSYYDTFEFVPVDETEAELVALNNKIPKDHKYGSNMHSTKDRTCAREIEKFNQVFNDLSAKEKKQFSSLKPDATDSLRCDISITKAKTDELKSEIDELNRKLNGLTAEYNKENKKLADLTAKLDGTDADRCDKRQVGASEVGNGKVDKDSDFDDGNEDEW